MEIISMSLAKDEEIQIAPILEVGIYTVLKNRKFPSICHYRETTQFDL